MARIILFYFILTNLFVSSQNVESNFSINQKTLLVDSSQTSFSFVVAGHIYGHPSGSVFPSPSIINSINFLNSPDHLFLMLLGDNYYKSTDQYINLFKSTFLDKINIPVYNALGNHDVRGEEGQDYSLYQKAFTGKTFYSYVVSTSLFIIIDSELYKDEQGANGSIKGEQLDFLRKTIEENVSNDKNIQNIFICVHKEINLWSNNNFEEEVKPILVSKKTIGKDIFILTGDLAKGTPDLYSFQEPGTNLTYVHTHIFNNRDDKILKFTVNQSGKVSIFPYSLTGTSTKEIGGYHFVPNQAEKPTFIGKFVKRITERFFMQGIAFTFLCLLILVFAYRFFPFKK